ncbi:hypothetical protein Hanom_Chr15g01388481 [Helianthus anomalus]
MGWLSGTQVLAVRLAARSANYPIGRHLDQVGLFVFHLVVLIVLLLYRGILMTSQTTETRSILDLILKILRYSIIINIDTL